jgi:hypothetical protein
VDVSLEAHDPLDTIERTQGSLDHGEAIEQAHACRFLTFFETDIDTEFAFKRALFGE